MADLAVFTTATLISIVVLVAIMHIVALAMRFRKKEISAAIGVVVVLYVLNIIFSRIVQYLGFSNDGILFFILSFGLYTAFIYLFYKESWFRSFLAAVLLSVLTFIIMYFMDGLKILREFL